MMIKKLIWTILIMVYCIHDPASVNMLDEFGDAIEEVREQIQVSRQLQFQTHVKVGSITRRQYGNNYSYYPYANELMTTFKQLCYLPDSLKDFEQILIDYYTGFPAAYYTQGSNSVTIIESIITKRALKGVLAHEFTHALQDQNFNIDSDVSSPHHLASKFNSDFYIAQKCVIEGDAEIQELKFLFGVSTIKAIVDTFSNRRNDFLNNIDNLRFPSYLNFRSYFPYYIGTYRVAKVLESSGYKGIDSLFHANRILSTAEVISGEKFEPIVFDVSSLINEWTRESVSIKFADDDNYGAMMLMTLLSSYIHRDSCSNTLGWRGDRLIYMRSNNDSWGKLVWSFAFKSENHAIYILNGLDQLLSSRKLNGISSQRTLVNANNIITYQTGTVQTSLIRSGSYLFWIENVNDAQTIASGILNSALAKRNSSEVRFEASPEIVKLKTKIIDRMIFKR